MRVVIIIPARYASTRFPGKPLVPLRGSGGEIRTLIHRSWDAARQVGSVERIVVATDDLRIAEAARGFGAEVVMTSVDCRNGTERCAEALAKLGESFDIVVNLQGDAPLTPPWFIEELVDALAKTSEMMVATPVLQTRGDALGGFLDDRREGRVGGTTVVFDRSGRALYFSKEVIPYCTGAYSATEVTPVFHHVGVYAYRTAALAVYRSWVPGRLEALEGLEQLRFLENGVGVLCVEVEARGRSFWELNNPEDVPRIEAMLMRIGMA
jgi:3-deoxy-manno-octulosonate cytidylyltransferase (CMP-KDO synthetase)